MTKQTAAPKNTRTQYSQSYKDDALALAERIGFSKAATQLGILESQLYYWRNKHVCNKARLSANNHWRMKMPS